jgi:hypothetical protein
VRPSYRDLTFAIAKRAVAGTPARGHGSNFSLFGAKRALLGRRRQPGSLFNILVTCTTCRSKCPLAVGMLPCRNANRFPSNLIGGISIAFAVVGSALFGFTVLFIFGLFAIWAGPGRGSGRGAGGPTLIGDRSPQIDGAQHHLSANSECPADRDRLHQLRHPRPFAGSPNTRSDAEDCNGTKAAHPSYRNNCENLFETKALNIRAPGKKLC